MKNLKIFLNGLLIAFICMLSSISAFAQKNKFEIPTEIEGDSTMLRITNSSLTTYQTPIFSMQNFSPGSQQDMIEMTLDPSVMSQYLEFQHVGGSLVGKINSDGSGSLKSLSLGNIYSVERPEIFRIETTGDNGIIVVGDDTGSAFLKLENNSVHSIYNDDSTDDLVLNADSGEKISFRIDEVVAMTVDIDGDIGIGTTNPASKLDISTLGYDGMSIRGDGSNDTYLLIQNGADKHYMFSDLSSGNNLDIQSYTGRDIAFNTGLIEQMVIQSDGDIGIGTDNPTMKLHIKHGEFSTDGLLLENDATNEQWQFYISSINDDLQIRHDGVFKGDFDNVSGVYTNASDKRLKTDIATLDPVMHKIMQIRPTSYKFKNSDSEKRYYGVIAQEVKEIFPSIIHTNHTEDIDNMLSVSYSELIPILIKGMQEQQEEIEAQKVLITNLMAEIKK